MEVGDYVQVAYMYPLEDFRGCIGRIIKVGKRKDCIDVVFEEGMGYFKFKQEELSLWAKKGSG